MKHSPTEILDAATVAFDQQGTNISMATIAKIAGVSNGTLFHYFPTKQVLLDQLYITLKTELATRIGAANEHPDPREQARHVWDRWYDWALEYPARHRVTLLLREAELISDDAAAAGLAAFTSLGASLSPSTLNTPTGDSLDWDYLSGLFIAQLEYAVKHELDQQQRADAFERTWRCLAPAIK